MKLMTRTRAGYLVTLAAGVGIGVALVGAAAAAPAAPARVRTVTHHYSLAASAFAPDGLHNTTEDYFNRWDPTTLSNSDGGRCFNAGLSLPTGATLKSVTAYFTEGTGALYFEINRQNLPTHGDRVLVSFDSATTAGKPFYTHKTKNFAKANAVVNFTNYAYSAGACPTGTSTFSGLIITYTQPS